jgi:hypothetical protein
MRSRATAALPLARATGRPTVTTMTTRRPKKHVASRDVPSSVTVDTWVAGG